MNIIWAEISCEAPGEMVDLLAEFLFELSGNGVCVENISVDTFSLDDLEDKPIKTVKGYFPVDGELEDKIAAIDAFLVEHTATYTGFAYRPPSVTRLKEEDWANNWKKHFKPSRIGRSLVIKPSWEAWDPADGAIIIEIDPGMAFGTGTHPTSRLCLETLERLFCRDAPFDSPGVPLPTDLLDVGVGSGILAIAAAKLGASRVVAIDIDPVAVKVAQENLALNKVAGTVSVSTAPLLEVAGQFAIVVANILAEDLVRMAIELVGKMLQGAFLVLSGILTEKEGTVLAGFSHLPLILVETTRNGEWSCITYRLER